MELLPVALPAAGLAGPAAASFLAGEKVLGSPSAHAVGRSLGQDTGDHGAAVPLGLLPSEEDSRSGLLPQLGQAFPAPAENFSVVWLSAVQMTEAAPPPAGLQSGTLSEDQSSENPGSENPSVARGSGPDVLASLTAAGAAARQTVLPASPLAAFAQSTITTSTGDQPNANGPVDGTPLVDTVGAGAQSVDTAEIQEIGIPKGELTETSMALPGQSREVEESDKPLRQENTVLNIRRSESNESADSEHALTHAAQFGNASPGLKTDALQEAPAADALRRDLPAIRTLTEEGRKPREAAALTPLLSMARGSDGDSGKTTNSSTAQSTAAANVARLSAMLAAVGQEPSASAETAFKAEISPSITEDGQAPAASDADAAHPARRGQQRAAANLSLQSLSSASSTGEAELLSDSSLSQPGNLPAKATTSYVADLPGSPRPATVSGAPRQPAPTAPPPAAELYAAGLDTARPTPKQAGDVTVQLRSEEHGTANIRFREHAGQVQVTVRAGDPQLVQSLRSGLDQLKSGLDTQGFQTTIWSGGSSSASSRRGDAEGSLDTYHRAHEDPSGQDRRSRDHSGGGNQQAEEWMDEIE